MKTKRKRADAALRESEERYRKMIDDSGDIIYRISVTGHFTLVNPVAARIMQPPPEELIGLHFLKLIREDYRTIAATFYAQQLKEEIPATYFEFPSLGKDGSEVWIGQNVQLVIEDAQVAGLQAVARDISTQKRIEKDLRESEERFRAIFERSVVGSSISTPDGRILACNQAFARIFGFGSVQEVMQSDAVSLYSDSRDRDKYVELLRQERQLESHEMELRRLDGTPVYVSESVTGIFDQRGELVEIHSHLIDITERKQAEEALRASQTQLQQSQKLEAIGQLAGGVAHDFNNLLTAIIGYSELSLKRLDSDNPIARNIEEIKKAAARAASLTRQLLAFSRKQILEPKVLDLNVAVSDMYKMLRRLIGEDIDLVTVLASDLERVKADPGQIEQVLMNLVVNARDAMPRGGKLTIETANVYLDDEYARQHLPTQPGAYVMLAISDTGMGMDRETQTRIFEPFFTTKETGKGTGLGLSTVYGIVKQSGGYVWVYSEVGKGTTFKVYLPHIDAALGEDLARSVSEPVPKGTETVLLVEDEEQVRRIAQEILATQGYQVLLAINGERALALAQQHEGEIDLMITDVVMPQMGGRELGERLSPLRPNMKVLYMSGYTDDAIVRHGLIDEQLQFIEKPFTADALARKVRTVLDSGENGRARMI